MKNNRRKKGIFYLILAYLMTKIVFSFFRKNKQKINDIGYNLDKFYEKEKNEVKQFECGKESFSRYFRHSCNIFRYYFIPHECNKHKPKILHSRSLAIIILLLVVLKVSLAGYLFFIFPQAGRTNDTIINKTLELINDERLKENLPPVKSNLALNISAHDKAEDMVAKSYFAHHSPDGKKPWDWIDRDQYRYLFVGENLAMNFTSAESAHRALMNSPSHKHNILNNRYLDVGLAMVTGIINGKTTNVLVQLFGTTKPVETKLVDATIDDSKQIAEEDGDVLDNSKQTTDNSKQAAEEVEQEPNLEGKTEVLSEGDITEEKITENKPEIEIVPEIINTPELVEAEPVEVVSSEPTVEEQVLDELELIETEAVETELAREESIEEDAKLAVLGETSPNSELERNIPREPIAYKNTVDGNVLFAARVARVVNYIFIALLIIMITTLIVNIIIRVEVQHKHVIIQTMLVILFISSLIYFKFHVLESGLPDVLIL